MKHVWEVVFTACAVFLSTTDNRLKQLVHIYTGP